MVNVSVSVVAGDLRAYPRRRAIAPAIICISTPTVQPNKIVVVQKMCVSERSTMIATAEKAASAARKVPTALRNSAASTFEPSYIRAKRKRPPDGLIAPRAGVAFVRLPSRVRAWIVGRVKHEFMPL
jgi:hypothetical protein